MEKYQMVPTIDTDTMSQHTIDVAGTPRLPQGSQSTKYIKVFGAPPIDSEYRQTPNDYILKSENPTEIVDVLDAMNEEPFTLETLEDLITIHWEKNLDFVLARVTTVDPNDEKRFYYSYYAAHHISKVLFRTQPDQGLLHRMKAKNPLNNMPIVGDVHYYVIKASPAVQKATKTPLEQLRDLISLDTPTTTRSKQIMTHFTTQKPTMFSRLFDTPRVEFLIKKGLYEDHEKKVSPEDHELKKIVRRNSFDDAYKDPNPIITQDSQTCVIVQNRHRNVRSIAFSNEKTDLMTIDEWLKTKSKPFDTKSLVDPDSPRKRHTTRQTTTTQDPVLFYEAHYYASDDDFLMHSSVRKYFKQNAIVSDDAILFTIQTSNDEDGEDHPTIANLALLLGENDERQQRMRKRLKYIVVIYSIGAFFLLKFASIIQLT